MTHTETISGLNIQEPWASLLIDGHKSVETRSYPLPKKYEGVELALISTPGKKRNFKAKIIGTITFSHSFKYENIYDFESDFNRHLVPVDHNSYGWKNNTPKYGWVVSNMKKLNAPIDAPSKRGIIFARDCCPITETL